MGRNNRCTANRGQDSTDGQNAVRRIFTDPYLGRLARACVEGQIEIEGDMRETMLICGKWVSAKSATYRKRPRCLSWWRHTRRADRKAIQHHYDVGNEFCELWLDRNRVYSCAYFKDPADSLDLAQEQKLEHICRKLQLKPEERLLDIGCGWGALISWAVRFGIKAVGITLPEERHALANQRIKELGLEDSCEARLLDYRDAPRYESFDKIASVGIFEHVGQKNLPVYFGKVRDLLKPGGAVLNHGITTNSYMYRECFVRRLQTVWSRWMLNRCALLRHDIVALGEQTRGLQWSMR